MNEILETERTFWYNFFYLTIGKIAFTLRG
jgi:hypothetical protein